ncbi:MAG: chemotaxis protein CheD [Deltaproteobacteria bacterium]|nr:chemotaxis protein CheD [Deltaproteobacteria bacterium]MBW2468258.1 chemotaxis protein CheD [Deltaproteobacteria bacterium]MBW2487086.1 chemotaxis protein CheD [Deltaproteobacteria bacterium]MBW2515216.1 chemotaxis protein CheD [Deltaproteobacteria bacterium]
MKSMVPIGDMKIACSPERLVTDALGSCLCLTAYDPLSGFGGLLHAMLPLSKVNLKKAETNPFMFVDTGIPALFEQLAAHENVSPKHNWLVKAIGCGNPMGHKEVFQIGERNYRTLHARLLDEGIRLKAEDVGGTACRTVCLDLAMGQTIVCSNGIERVL